VQVNSDIAGKNQGTLARLDVSYFVPVNSHLILSVGPGITWASNEYTQTFFGVTAAQSANSGLPTYNADGGLNSVRLSAAALYRFNRHWSGSASVSVSELRGDAANSPITQSTTRNVFFAGALYRF
jgi:outer membrane protein